MKHSGPRRPDSDVSPDPAPRLPLGARAGLAALELLARVSVPASVLLLSRGAAGLAAASSAIALLAAIGRGFATSFAVERALRATFAAVVRAALELSVVELRAERKIGILAEAAREAAMYEVTVAPLVGAYAVATAATWAALIVVLGPLWAVALALAAAPLVLALWLGARRIRVQQEAAWSAFSELAIDLRVLVEACLELRAHDREPSFAAELIDRSRSFARSERRASVWSAATGAVPSALVLLSAATPLGARIGAVVEGATGRRAAEIAIVAGAALYFALGFGKLLEHRARFTPLRATLRAFLAAPQAAAPARAAPLDRQEPEAELPSLGAAAIRFRDVSCRHPGAQRATPAAATHTWSPGRGLLLAGENGAGKSTLVLALLGLLSPAEGAIEVDGVAIGADNARALRRRTAYLAQSPFVEPGASVAWHLRLFAPAPLDAERIDGALRRAGLWRTLAEHAARRGDALAPRDVLAGELSGGERQRMHIARLLVQEAELLILDEPEAGLDRQARSEMAALFDELSRGRRVLLIAHDPAIAPASFERLDVRPEPRQSGAP